MEIAILLALILIIALVAYFFMKNIKQNAGRKKKRGYRSNIKK
ncbi:MAG: hypothetical protein ACLFR2_00635 [Candidatus Kapaibacterium sp.]